VRSGRRENGEASFEPEKGSLAINRENAETTLDGKQLKTLARDCEARVEDRAGHKLRKLPNK
jgi:hypothetical protein